LQNILSWKNVIEEKNSKESVARLTILNLLIMKEVKEMIKEERECFMENLKRLEFENIEGNSYKLENLFYKLIRFAR
jgi:hypothetical protein